MNDAFRHRCFLLARWAGQFTKVLLCIWMLTLTASQADACPNLSGRFDRQYDDGIVHFTVRQKGCERVEIDNASTYEGKASISTEVFIPDGKPHGNGVRVSRWNGNRLQIGEKTSLVYYAIDAAGDLHFSDGRYYPQCKGPCDEVAAKLRKQKKK